MLEELLLLPNFKATGEPVCVLDKYSIVECFSIIIIKNNLNEF
jgi:hypothetical protein